MSNVKNEWMRGSPAWLRVVIGVVLLVTCARVWLGPGVAPALAQAQLPNPAAQRNQIVDEVRRTNLLLADIKSLLEIGTLNVRIKGADNQADEAGRAPLRP